MDFIISKANKLLGFIYRSTKAFSNIRCLIVLYVSIVRSVAEYCSVVWSPSYSTRISRIEKIQSKFIKALCLKCGIEYSSTNYDHLLHYFSLPRLESRRKYCDIVFIFKVVNSFIKCPDISNLLQFYIPSNHSLRNNPLLQIEYHRTNYGMHSPIVRMSRAVNDVHSQVDVLSGSLIRFKRDLKRLLYRS